MKKLYIIVLITLTCIFMAQAFAEEFTMSTYYPAPFGVYREMNVNYLDFKNDEYQEASPTNLPVVEEGRLFYDKNTKEVKYSPDGANWQSLGGVGDFTKWTWVGHKWVADGTQISCSAGCVLGTSTAYARNNSGVLQVRISNPTRGYDSGWVTGLTARMAGNDAIIDVAGGIRDTPSLINDCGGVVCFADWP